MITIKRRKFFLHLFFLFMCWSCFANPFTGNKKSPAPVYQSKPSERLIKKQKIIHEKLGEYIAVWKTNNSAKKLFSVLALAFLYGIIHAAGPGHRKTVIFSFYITRPAKAVEPLLLGAGLAAIHGGTAIVLMLIFKSVSGAISVKTNNASLYMEGLSFIILVLLSIYSIMHVISDLKHKHHNDNVKLKLSAILLSGMYPCPAALLVLVLTLTMDILPIGILSVIAMSTGMSLPIIFVGYFAWAGRSGLFKQFANNKKTACIIAAILELLGYCFLLGLSLYTAMPFILSLIMKR